jgi:hypothetical protein
MKTLTIEITDTEYSAMQYIALSPEDWAENAVHARAKTATDEIVQLTVRYCLDNGLNIPQTTDEIIAFAYSQKIIKTVEEKNAEVQNV